MSPRGYPDLKHCRAKAAGFGDYVDCLSAKPECCVFALSFGDGFLCRHAERQRIVAQTNTHGLTLKQEMVNTRDQVA
jgi:hypothetical protein